MNIFTYFPYFFIPSLAVNVWLILWLALSGFNSYSFFVPPVFFSHVTSWHGPLVYCNAGGKDRCEHENSLYRTLLNCKYSIQQTRQWTAFISMKLSGSSGSSCRRSCFHDTRWCASTQRTALCCSTGATDSPPNWCLILLGNDSPVRVRL